MAATKMQKAAKKAANLGRALVSALRDPEIKEAIHQGVELAKESAAKKSLAGRTENALRIATSPPVLAIADALLGWSVQQRRKPKQLSGT